MKYKDYYQALGVARDTSAACVHLHGKGRKQRSVPLRHATVKSLRAWLRANHKLTAEAPLLPNRNGYVMTRANVTLSGANS